MGRLGSTIIVSSIAVLLGSATVSAQDAVVVAVPAKAGAVDGTSEKLRRLHLAHIYPTREPSEKRDAVACGIRDLGIGRRYLLAESSLANAGPTHTAARQRVSGHKDAQG